MTKQSHAAESDINNIMDRYFKTGIVEHVATVQGKYGDFTSIPTYQEALDKIRRAQEMFMSLPSDIRAKFQNDPGEFLDFATNPENRDEMIEMGLIEPVRDTVVPEPFEPEPTPEPEPAT